MKNALHIDFRVKEDQGVLIVPDTYKEELINEYHWGRESEYSAFSSFVLPKGSPLKVRVAIVIKKYISN